MSQPHGPPHDGRVYLVFWDARTGGVCYECPGIQYKLDGVYSTLQAARDSIPETSGTEQFPDRYIIKEQIPDTPLTLRSDA